MRVKCRHLNNKDHWMKPIPLRNTAAASACDLRLTDSPTAINPLAILFMAAVVGTPHRLSCVADKGVACCRTNAWGVPVHTDNYPPVNRRFSVRRCWRCHYFWCATRAEAGGLGSRKLKGINVLFAGGACVAGEISLAANTRRRHGVSAKGQP